MRTRTAQSSGRELAGDNSPPDAAAEGRLKLTVGSVMNVGIGCAVTLDAHSRAILLGSLLALVRGNATFFEMSTEVQMNIMWLADVLSRDLLMAVTAAT
jgi:hypothetical protein